MIRRACGLLAALTLIVSCAKDRTGDPVWIAASQDEVLLAGTEGSEAEFSVEALGDWTLTTSGTGFDADPGGGSKGGTRITVRATQPNTQKERITLGEITLRYTANGSERTVTVRQSPVTAPQTMLLYMPGRALANFYENNVKGIREAVNAFVPGDGRILVCRQSQSQSQAELFEIYYDIETQQSAAQTLKTYGQFNAADPASLRTMLTDAAALAPADRYGLIVGCHGKAWVPAKNGVMSSYALRAGDAGDDLWTPAPDALQTRSFGDTGYEIDIQAFAEVLEALPYDLDYLVFDACFMANIETIYDLRNAAEYFVSAPCEIMSAGFPYARIVPYLFADGGTQYALQRVCEEFYRFYNDDWQSVEGNAQSGCISMTVMSEVGALVPIMQRINATPNAYDPGELQYYEGMLTHLFYDLGDYVETICSDKTLLTEFTAQFDKAFPPACRLATPAFYSAYNPASAPGPGTGMHPVTHYSGISTSEPSAKYTDDNRRTAWYLATH